MYRPSAVITLVNDIKYTRSYGLMMTRNNSPLDQLLEEIRFQRRKELRSQDPGFSSVRNTTYWTDLFVRHFLFQSDRSLDSDDLLFFVRKGGQSAATWVWSTWVPRATWPRVSSNCSCCPPSENVYCNTTVSV